MFGRARFHHGKEAPKWWSDLPPQITSPEFTVRRLEEIFHRRRGSPLKAVLLAQEVFPGIGNWMADEILWQLKLPPKIKTGDLDAQAIARLWKTTRTICRTALKTIGVDWSDPPKSWLLLQRFKAKGTCPRDGSPLKRCVVATRTTVFCAICQKNTSSEALCDDGDRTESGS
jgi:formamidopyrimidine-DNA glycosylase